MSRAPWEKGKHSDYTGFVMEVHVRKDQRTGSVDSFRCLQDQTDEEAAHTLGPTGGMEEGSWSLLTEAARAEVLLQLLWRISNTPHFKEKLVNAEEAPQDLLEMVSQDTLNILQKGMSSQIPHLVKEAMDTVRDGLRHENG